MVVPPINTKGNFKLAAPYTTLMNSVEEYKVTAIRSLEELAAEKPFENIYKPVGLTVADMNSDMANNIPIVVFITTGEEYIYVPANRILAMPTITGVKHQERMLAIPLGMLPVDFDLTLVTNTITDLVYHAVGNKVKVEVVDTSAVVLIDDINAKALDVIRKNKIKIHKSYKTRYEEAVVLLERKDKLIEKYVCYIKNIINNKEDEES